MKKHFITAVGALEQLESFNKLFGNYKDFPRIAFIGRSNVGKSSLINSLFGGEKIAYTSKSPGMTKKINFFLLEKLKVILADFPGYGFAKRSHKQQNLWAEVMESYIKNDKHLKVLFILLDARHGPTEIDLEAIKYFYSLGVDCRFVMTKFDTLKSQKIRSERQKSLQRFIDERNYSHDIIWTSSTKNTQIESFLRSLKNL